MKKLLIVAVVAVLFIGGYLAYNKSAKEPANSASSTAPVAVGKYGEAFNNSLDAAIQQYYTLSEKFVAWDSAGVTNTAGVLQESLTKVPWDVLQSDTAIATTATTTLQSLETDFSILRSTQSLETRRHSFHALSQSMYDLLRTIHYQGGTVYLMECPMAFNDNEPANWLSAQTEIRNPYLGLKHPRYKGGMVTCGEVKDSLDYVTKK